MSPAPAGREHSKAAIASSSIGSGALVVSNRSLLLGKIIISPREASFKEEGPIVWTWPFYVPAIRSRQPFAVPVTAMLGCSEPSRPGAAQLFTLAV
jgi:hypothetical protein